MSLLRLVHVMLEQAGIPHVLCGAAAMAAHGVARSTLDLDVLCLDDSCLDPRIWRDVRAAGVEVEIRRGDEADPLSGVVVVEAAGETPVDVVVPKGTWQRAVFGRAVELEILGVRLAVASRLDLILLKLDAGGLQDRWDVLALLGVDDRLELVAGVEAELDALPERCRSLWRRLLSDGA